MDLFLDVLLDSVKDTLELVPFLFLTYLAMEALEHSTEGRTEALIRRAGAWGPAVGALLGALPQCGFSAMAGTLYAGRIVTAGTLVAVILSTSDELIPVFLAHQVPAGRLVAIVVIKILVGLVAGFAADAVLRALHRTGDGHPHIRELCERAHCHCGDVDEAEDEDEASDARGEDAASTSADGAIVYNHAHVHAHHRTRAQRWLHIARSACVHTLEVTFFIFVITFAFGMLMEAVGSDTLAGFFAANPALSTFVAALVGLIPNCGASVLIAELFLDGTLATGPMLAGLLVAGGMGLLVLYRTNGDLRQNVIITVFIYLVGVCAGLAAAAVGLVV